MYVLKSIASTLFFATKTERSYEEKREEGNLSIEETRERRNFKTLVMSI